MKEISEIQKPLTPFRRRLHETIFESDTFLGRFFDAVLISLIILSSITVVLESVPSVEILYSDVFFGLEIFFTSIFTLEYILRILSLRNPFAYVKSFFGVVDLISVLPMYVSLIVPGAQALMVVRILRMLRLFRLFKMVRYVRAANVLRMAFMESMPKIIVFLITIFSVVVILGSLMYMAEVHNNPKIGSIPEGIYWSIITITTVGYGDVVPITFWGKVIASMMAIIGFGVFAVPTGIISVQLAKIKHLDSYDMRDCPSCGKTGHDEDSKFCKYCGGNLKH